MKKVLVLVLALCLVLGCIPAMAEEEGKVFNIHDVLSAADISHWIITPTHTYHI